MVVALFIYIRDAFYCNLFLFSSYHIIYWLNKYNRDEDCVSELLNWSRHVGDLGNIVVTDGQVYTTITDNVISLYGNQTILNRSIVVGILTHI